jgi:hypothetical protein
MVTMSTSKRVPPKPVSPPQPNYSINEAPKMAGKTVASVDVGDRRQIPQVHEGELIVIHFTDGTALSIDTGSNAKNLSQQHKGLKPEDFHTDFMLEWF